MAGIEAAGPLRCGRMPRQERRLLDCGRTTWLSSTGLCERLEPARSTAGDPQRCHPSPATTRSGRTRSQHSIVRHEEENRKATPRDAVWAVSGLAQARRAEHRLLDRHAGEERADLSTNAPKSLVMSTARRHQSNRHAWCEKPSESACASLSRLFHGTRNRVEAGDRRHARGAERQRRIEQRHAECCGRVAARHFHVRPASAIPRSS